MQTRVTPVTVYTNRGPAAAEKFARDSVTVSTRSIADLYFRFAGLIDKIFKGANPDELPVEQPTKCCDERRLRANLMPAPPPATAQEERRIPA
jgi:hypothetical protein